MGIQLSPGSPSLMRGQAPSANQVHTLVPKGKVGLIPTPATHFFGGIAQLVEQSADNR